MADDAVTLPADAGFTEDAFLGGKITARQPQSGFRAGIDAVFLAAGIPALPGERVLELGTGCGIAALCLMARVDGLDMAGIDIEPDLCALAARNAQANGFGGSMRVIEADITKLDPQNPGHGLAPGSFAHVFANPPYYQRGTVRMPPDRAKARAFAETPGDLARWIKLMIELAAPKASVTLIHVAERLGDILALAGPALGAITVTALHPSNTAPASRVIVQGIKGSRAPFRLNPGLILHQADGGYTPPAVEVLRHGAPFGLR
jgi:tRNA1(Val) A37 N6-methylase TrmN6